MTEQVKVSVIVPVYNPGSHLRRCVDSVLGQSLPKSDFEAIFVDDGSTDGSPAHLDTLATAYPNIRVIHQENSGWPGQPRNVGIDAARGEYVFFLDHDDALGPDALERLHDLASRNDSDIVIGKMVGHGRWVAAQLFGQTRDRVTLWDAPIVEYLTPHKLFRRAFLDDHGLRFPEGRRRLEDHIFVLEAYFSASVISVLADPVCYHFYQRRDYGGASTGLTDPDAYYGYVREVLQVVEAHTEPGQKRDVLLERFVRIQMLNRLSGPRFLAHPVDYRRSLFSAIRSVVEDDIPPSVDELLSPFQRTQMAIVRADRLDLMVEAARWAQRFECLARLGPSERSGSNPFDLTIEARVAAGREPLTLERRDDRFVIGLPPSISAVVPDAARAVKEGGHATVVARRRGDLEETPIQARAERLVEAWNGGYAIVDRIEATIDPAKFALTPPTRPMRWDVVVRTSVAGLIREAPVAEIRLTVEHGVVLHRGIGAYDRPLARRARRLGLDAMGLVDRHLNDRLRHRVWHVAARIARRLGP